MKYNQGDNAKSMNAHDIYFPYIYFILLRKLLIKIM
jgi:hypothetical protein